MNWEPLILTFKLALVTTGLLLVLSIPLAYWLAFSRSRAKPFVETLVSMPLVLPPTVLGFYLLLLLGPRGAVGGLLDDNELQRIWRDANAAAAHVAFVRDKVDLPFARALCGLDE